MYKITQNHYANTNQDQPQSISQRQLSDHEQDIISEGINCDFEQKNHIYQLKSRINALLIEKQHILISHQSLMDAENRKVYEISSRYDKLLNQHKGLHNDNKRLSETLDHVVYQNESLKKQIQHIKEQFEKIISDNRRTAEFQKSGGDYDNLQILKQLDQKDKIIKSQEVQLLNLKDSFGLVNQGTFQAKIQQLQKENSNIKRENEQNNKKIEQNKKREMDIKRQYQNMLQSKEEIIKKLTYQSQQHSKTIINDKDKLIVQMKTNIQDLMEQINGKKEENKTLIDKNYNFEKEINKLKKQSLKKNDDVKSQHQAQIQQHIKILNEKYKLQIKQKQQKIIILQSQYYQCESEVSNLKTQIMKYKNQLTSLMQQISYIESINKQLQFSKKRSHEILNEKQNQLVELRQQTFNQTNEYKKNISQLKKQMEEHVSNLETDLYQKRLQLQRLDKKIKIYQQADHSQNQNINGQFKKVIETLRKENDELREGLSKFSQKYQNANQKLSLESIAKKQLEDRIKILDQQITTYKAKEMKQIKNQQNQQYREQNNKLKAINENINDNLKIKNEENKKISHKMQQISHNYQISIQNYKQLQKQYNNKRQDYSELQQMYEELEEKYRQIKVEDVSEDLKKQKRRYQKKHQEYKLNQQKLLNEIKKLKSQNCSLEDQIESLRNGTQSNVQEMSLKIQRLAHQLSLITKQKENAIKNSQMTLKNKTRQYEEDRQKLKDYVKQLEDRCSLMNRNNNVTSVKELKQIEQENLRIRMQYSETLKQLNIILTKYKQIQDKNKQYQSQEEYSRTQIDNLHHRYRQVCIEKNKVIAELDSTYDQIQKLNAALLAKDKSIPKDKLSCPHYTPETDKSSRITYNGIFNQKQPVFQLSKDYLNPNQLSIRDLMNAEKVTNRVESQSNGLRNGNTFSDSNGLRNGNTFSDSNGLRNGNIFSDSNDFSNGFSNGFSGSNGFPKRYSGNQRIEQNNINKRYY